MATAAADTPPRTGDAGELVPGTAAADHGPAAIAYRPDIDGLRALAVIAVVLFHVGVASIPGGFTGVDIFFVISGYLIGGQIFREVEAGRFCFGAFYTRRVRRILPALFAMLGVLYLVGLLLLTPAELRELGKEAAPTVWGLSNLLFYTGGDYFAPAAEFNPLLMTWSLGVEEQFYLIFPLVLLLVMRVSRRHALAGVVLLSVLSFAGSLLLVRHDPQAAFYLLPTRAWELGVGSALALWEPRAETTRVRRDAGGWSVELAGIAALALLVAALFAYRSNFAFPGPFAVLPVAGAALLIAARTSTVNRWLFGNPAATFVGRISYSLYLWHWPILYLNRAVGEGAASPALLVLASFGLAILSWRLVEQPLRHRVLPQRTVLIRYTLAALAVSGMGAFLYAANGLPQRLDHTTRGFAEEAARGRHGPCLAPYGASAPVGLPACVAGLENGRPGVLLMGDSHASALAPGIADAAREAGLGFGEMTKSSCLPVLGAARNADGRAAHWGQCLAYQDRAVAWLATHPGVRLVVLGGYWSNGATVLDRGGRTVPVADALEATVRRIEALGRRVVIAQDAPSFAFDPYARVIGDALPLRAVLAGRHAAGGPSVSAPLADPSRPALARLAAARPGRALFDPAATLCGNGRCHYALPGSLFYLDPQHLTESGARTVACGSRLAALFRYQLQTR